MSAAREEFEPEVDEPWVLISEQFFLGHTYDKAIVSALRKLDPDVAPLWVLKTYKAPGHADPVTVGRHLIARYIREPRVRMKIKDFDQVAIWNVVMPTVMPEELKGLPSGPYFSARLLEGESPDGTQPGEYLPMSWALVKKLEWAMHAMRTHTMDQLNTIRREGVRSKRAKAKDERDQRFRDMVRAEAEWRKTRAKELVRVPSQGGTRVGMSEQLMRLRKIAAEGVSA